MKSSAAAFWSRATPDIVDRRSDYQWPDDADNRKTVALTSADLAARVLEIRMAEQRPKTKLRPPAVAQVNDDVVRLLVTPAAAMSASVVGFLLCAALMACSMSVAAIASLGMVDL